MQNKPCTQGYKILTEAALPGKQQRREDSHAEGDAGHRGTLLGLPSVYEQY